MLEPVRIAPTADYLLRDGKPFLYLADTCWSGFTNPTLDEWAYYVDFRRRQGFTALQINIMPQGDRSDNTWDAPVPFVRNRGKYDWTQPNPEYFQRAGQMARMAADAGLVPALVLMWGDMVPDTWIHKTYKTHPIPLDLVRPFAERVVHTFADSKPIWIVSGDTDLPDSSKPWFFAALTALRELTPDLLCMFHIDAKQPLPDEWPDIYTIYSGHSVDSGTHAARQAAGRWAKPLRRPTINGEPCYEAHAQSGTMLRFSAHDVRRAIWSGLLSGAKAGSAYGAHGIWSWHRQGVPFCAQQHSGEPLDWRVALNLPGGWDMGIVRALWEQHRLWELIPRQDLLAPGTPDDIRVSATADATRIVAYLPYAREVLSTLDLSTYDLKLFNLTERRYEYPALRRMPSGSAVPMTQSNSDALLIASAL